MMKKVKTTIEEDRISQLPNHILASILSSVTIREAVSTSVLSSRWRYLWITSISTFNLHPDNILDMKEYNLDVNRIGEVQNLIIPWKRMMNFVISVNQLLRQLPQDHKMHKLRVHYPFRRNRYGCILDQWIDFAVSRGAEELDIDLYSEGYFDYAGEGEDYDFPCDVIYSSTVSSLKCLRLNACIFTQHQLSNFSNCFSSLKTIDFQCIGFQGGLTVESLLCHFPQLEWLSFYKCRNIVCVKIRHPSSPRLKYLAVQACYDVEEIEIDGLVELAWFEYSGPLLNFSFKEVPWLVNVYLHVTYSAVVPGTIIALTRLPEILPQLENLLLHCSCYMEDGLVPERFPTFRNLKHLVVIEIAIFKRDLLWIAPVLKASPLLQKLELHLSTYHYDEEPKEIQRPPRSPLNHLKEAIISGTRGYLSEIEIAVYVLNNAITLEKMTIDPRRRYYLGDGKWEMDYSDDIWARNTRDEWANIGRQRVLEHLLQEVPPNVKLEVL